MTYEETLDFLFKQLPVYQIEGGRAYKPGLERTREILSACGRPDRELTALHVAGTNGKGSTSYLLASVLRAAGLRVGLFTSPHIVTYRERIRINGEMIPEEYITRFVEQFLHDLGDHLQPSFFELTTALAFRYFVDERVDIAVVEVGMGGRLDSTNVLRPLVSVITNVSMDHMQFLGNTLGEIAYEKAGIIKPHTPVVLGRSIDEPVLEVVRAKAAEEQAPLTLADRSSEILSHEEIEGVGYRVETKTFGTIDLPLMGAYQLQNLGTVLETIKLIRDRYGITPEMVREGVARVADFGLSGRLQMIRQSDPRIFIDAGHNIGAWAYLGPQLETWAGDGGLAVVLGMSADKDVDHVLERLPRETHLICTRAHVERAMSGADFAEHARSHGIEPVLVIEDVREAYRAAIDYCRAHSVRTLFVGGSFFVLSDLLSDTDETAQ